MDEAEIKEKINYTREFFKANKETLVQEYNKLFVDIFATKVERLGNHSINKQPEFLLHARKLLRLMGSEHVHYVLLPKILGILSYGNDLSYREFLSLLLTDKRRLFRNFCAILNVHNVDRDDYGDYVESCTESMASFFDKAESFAQRELQAYLSSKEKRVNYFFELARNCAKNDLSSTEWSPENLGEYADGLKKFGKVEGRTFTLYLRGNLLVFKLSPGEKEFEVECLPFEEEEDKKQLIWALDEVTGEWVGLDFFNRKKLALYDRGRWFLRDDYLCYAAGNVAIVVKKPVEVWMGKIQKIKRGLQTPPPWAEEAVERALKAGPDYYYPRSRLRYRY